MRKIRFLLLLTLLSSHFAWAETEPTLTITSAAESNTFSRADLLKLKSTRPLNVPKDPGYGNKPRRYLHAVPAFELFKTLAIDSKSTISFRCLDGFSAPIDRDNLLNSDRNKSIAFIAIETDDDKWPELKKDSGKSAGPFYLVWEHPEKSKVKTEEWPFQVVAFDVAAKSVADLFPNAQPGKEVPADTPIGKGYTHFMKNCFACHAMNGDGVAKIGPDLNLPESAADYMKREYFFKLVRNPQSLRAWPGSKMSSFDKSQLSDEDIAQIWLYLGYMSKRKNRTR